MSKRLKNYPDPAHILDTYAADALRLYMINSPIVRAEDLCFTEEGVVHSLRHLLIPWWNAYTFFVTYANVDNWAPTADPDADPASDNPLDRWIISATDRLAGDVVAAMDQYDLQQAVRPLVQFLDDLTNWYIRRSRRRFWKSGDDTDKASAYATLHSVLLRLCRIAAPFVPFISEEIYRNLRTPTMPDSVHLGDDPLPGQWPRDAALDSRMTSVMRAVTLARQLRADRDLKVRQPLAALHVVSRDAALLDAIRPMTDILADELNVKTVVFSADETALATLTAKANYKALGPKYGAKMRPLAAAIAALDSAQLSTLLASGTLAIDLDGAPLAITPDDILLQRTPKPGLAVASEGDLVVALDTNLTPDLVSEGLARELVNRIQNLRKDTALDVTDRITLTLSAAPALLAAAETHRDFIQSETLSITLTLQPLPASPTSPLDINGHHALLSLQKA